MGGTGLEREFAAVAGVVLVCLGLIGFLDNPLVGDPGTGALISTAAAHDLGHVMMGALFIHVAVVFRGRAQAGAVIVLGAVLLVTGLLSFVSADLFGLYGGPTSGLDQLLHLLLGGLAIVIGWLARGGAVGRVGRRPMRAIRG